MPVIFEAKFPLHGIAMIATSRGHFVDIAFDLPERDDVPLFDVLEITGRERLHAGQEWLRVYIELWCAGERASVERVRAYIRRFDLVK